MALLEAMSVGLPSIASAVGQIPQIITSGENGLLINPGDSKQLSEAIVQLAEDRNLVERLSENARRTVEDRFSIGPWVQKIENVYAELLNGRKRGKL